MIGKFSTDEDTEKLQKESVNQNTKAMALLLTTLTTPIYRMIIHTSKFVNLDWPTDLAWDVMKQLQTKYKPEDTISAVEFISRLKRLKIKESDHSDLLFDELAEIYITYGYQLDSTRQHSEIMVKSPKKYMDTLAYMKSLMIITKEALTLDHLQHALNKFWRIDHADDSESEDENEDEKTDILATGVGSIAGDKKKEITCFMCGISRKNYGNRNNIINGNKFNGKCHNCGKTRHRKADCWTLNERPGQDIAVEMKLHMQ